MHMTTDGKIGGEHSTDRYYKVGDVIRAIPVTQGHSAVRDKQRQGLGIVVEADGPRFEAYWTGDGKLRKGDSRPIGYAYKLQDLAPIPQVAESIKRLEREFVEESQEDWG